MKINILKMNFVDRKSYYTGNLKDEIINSKRMHLIAIKNLIFLTSRIRDKKLKHKHRPIPVKKGNKINVNQL